MKILKWLLGIAGVAGLIAVGVLLAKFALDSRELIGAAQRYTGATPIQDPFVTTSMIAGVAALAGLVLGLGLGLPTRTATAIRNAALDGASAKREAEIRSRAAGTGELPKA